MRKRMFPVSWLAQARLAEIATVVDESVSGVRVVKSFAAERSRLSLLQRDARKVQWAYVRDADIRGRWAPLIENAPRLGLALVLLFGGWLVIEGHTTIGAIVAFNAYILQLQAPFRQLGFLLMLSQRARASAGRIYEVLDEQPEIIEHPGAVDLLDSKGRRGVRRRDLLVRAGGVACWTDFDLRLEPGETVALVGATGSGKSTVARLVNRFYDVQDGAVRDRRQGRPGADGRQPARERRHRARRAVPVLGLDPRQHRVRDARPPASTTSSLQRRRPAPTSSSRGCRTATTPWSASAGSRSPADSASGSRSRGPCLQPADPHPRRRDEAIDVHVEQQIHDALSC